MYQISELLRFPKLFHVFSTKDQGNMAITVLGKVQNLKQVSENRDKFFIKARIDIERTVCMWVQHKDEIIIPRLRDGGKTMKDYKKALKVDGLLTDKKDLYLFLLIADCLPVILYDPAHEVVGLLHVGWQGLDLELIKKAVKILSDKFKTKAEDLIVGIGPCVLKDSYIKENPSQKDDPRWKPYLEKVNGDKYKVDLVEFAKNQFMDCGCNQENIFESGIDTATDDRFFSHVRDFKLPIEKQGRFACVVSLK